MAERDAGPGREGSARRCKEEATADATDGLAHQALARMGLSGEDSSEKRRLLAGRLPHLYIPPALSLSAPGRPLPSARYALAPTAVRDPGLLALAAAVWLLSELELVRAEVAEKL